MKKIVKPKLCYSQEFVRGLDEPRVSEKEETPKILWEVGDTFLQSSSTRQWI